MNITKAITNPLSILKIPFTKKEKIKNSSARRLKRFLLNKIKHGLAGQTESKVKGSGLDFASIRQYSVGDDVRYIDWNVFARTTVPHVREYMADKQQTLWFVVDVSESMNFGKINTKQQVSAELMEIWSVVSEQIDARIGIIAFDDNKTQLIRASTKTRIPQEFNLNQSKLDKLLFKTISSGDVVMFISDFIEFPYYNCLKYISSKSKINIFLMQDSSESNLPKKYGFLNLIDPETKEVLNIDTNDTKKIEEIKKMIQSYQEETLSKLKRIGKVFIINTEDNLIKNIGRKK